MARTPGVEFALDATPSYVFWPNAMERIRDYDPGMRLILSFRDPVERAFSHWSMIVGRAMRAGRPSLTFQDVVRSPIGPEFLKGAPAGLSKMQLRSHTAAARGYYGAQMQRMLELFPRDQVLPVDFHAMVKDQPRTAARLVESLGLPPYLEPVESFFRSPTQSNMQGPPPPTGEDIRTLADRYREDLQLFTELSGLDTSSWTTSRILAGPLDPDQVADKLGRKAGLIS